VDLIPFIYIPRWKVRPTPGSSITAPQKATSLSNARKLGLDPIRSAVAIALLLAEPSVYITSRRHLLCVGVEDFLQAAAPT
jgi:hypothetical protein